MMNLNQKYDRADFIDFLQTTFLSDYAKDVRPVGAQGLSAISKATSLGRSDSLDLQVFEFEFTGSANKRVTLTKEAFQIMKQSATFNALAVFYGQDSDDWRLSFLTANPQRTEKGKVTIAYSNPRRYSFFLGSNAKINTPTKFLINKRKIISFEDLKNRFSIEVVNKEFYKEISKAFRELSNGLLKLPFIQEKSQTNLEFAVRLIGRIIFCWFLREKKSESGLALMPNELLSLEAVNKNEDYYHKILEPIFFEVLNKPVKSRKGEFSKDPFSSAPYLNGGLFSPLDDDFYKRNNGDFQSQFHNTLVVPDKWFMDFFETLETYNFTIDENTSFDEELSIDPEMLGRIFENLLAEINPETGESARKATGSYYTPRTIVSYMVDESLLLYLKQKTNIDENKLREIISYDLADDSEYSISQEEKEKTIGALESLKLLDPACGSGAFPIGALQKIVFILQQIDPDGQLWFRKQLLRTSPELRRVIEREFEHQNFDYIRKLGIIRENIYGIDIQPIATEISRLRCFLTLIVDERVQDKLENRGIEPLPNLDFKFVTANSLIGLSQNANTGQLGMFDDQEKIDDLKTVRDQYFTASGIEREQLKAEFSKLQKDLIFQLVQEHGFMSLLKAELTHKLTEWDPFSHKASTWFDLEWMFGIKDGFDIVIANPPYIDSESMVRNGQEDFRDCIAENFKYTRGNWDIYVAFFEKGLETLMQNGILTYISPDKWISKPFGKELRANTLKYMYSLLKSGRNIFETVNVDSIVTIFEKKESDNIRVLNMEKDSVMFIRTYLKKKIKPPYTLDFLFSDNLGLLEKIENSISGKNLLTINCENACATSDAYKLVPLLRNLSEQGFDPEKHLKIVNTGTIGKYTPRWGFQEMTYLGKKYLFPTVLKQEFISKFNNSYSRKSTKSKIILKGLNLLDACLDADGIVIPGKSTLIVCSNNISELKFLMAILNSTLPPFYLKEKYPASSYNQGTTFTKDMINNFPIPQLSTQEQHEFVAIVDKIILLKQAKNYSSNEEKKESVSDLQKHLNQMVYDLYGLTEKEIRIVEGRNE